MKNRNIRIEMGDIDDARHQVRRMINWLWSMFCGGFPSRKTPALPLCSLTSTTIEEVARGSNVTTRRLRFSWESPVEAELQFLKHCLIARITRSHKLCHRVHWIETTYLMTTRWFYCVQYRPIRDWDCVIMCLILIYTSPNIRQN